MSEFRTTTSRWGSVTRSPRLTLAAKPALSLTGEDLDALDRAQRSHVLGSARVVGDDDPCHPGGDRPLDDSSTNVATPDRTSR